MQKVVTRDSLHYRKLTDKAQEDSSKESKKEDDGSEKSDGSMKGDEDEEALKSLALGKFIYQLG